MSSPIAISLSNVGVRAFKNTSIATLPYVLLDEKQAQCVRDLLEHIRQGVSSTITSDANGGFLVRLPVPATNIFVDRNAVMQHLANAIHSTPGYGDKDVKDRVFSVLSQRISALTTVPTTKKIE
eukprot:1213268-Rhodomonas_salina.1